MAYLFFNLHPRSIKSLFSLILKLLYKIGDWGLGIGDWGLGIGDWAQSPIPNPQLFFIIEKNFII